MVDLDKLDKLVKLVRVYDDGKLLLVEMEKITLMLAADLDISDALKVLPEKVIDCIKDRVERGLFEYSYFSDDCTIPGLAPKISQEAIERRKGNWLIGLRKFEQYFKSEQSGRD